MTLDIGYTICTVLAIIVAVRAARHQRGSGRGPITGFVVGIIAGSATGLFLMATMIVIATPESHIEKVEPVPHEQPAT
ncbi:hypothetical protein [Larsenimonas rhizosphaerae]|uniref:hypothetical protein n=1 Tax=Larsenimonas rhizosphaerae TaxID=2944682 RepID=UPI00203373E1|nr:hypothetical protein [Larsenimonas rhizosphaerae]MCM2131447.1 hypothetical protein [Larsenimonas rhizosphaerae]